MPTEMTPIGKDVYRVEHLRYRVMRISCLEPNVSPLQSA